MSDSRNAESPDRSLGAWVRGAVSEVGWYTSDWVVRMRRCGSCLHSEATVEVPVGDLREIVKGRSSG